MNTSRQTSCHFRRIVYLEYSPHLIEFDITHIILSLRLGIDKKSILIYVRTLKQ